MFLLPKQVECSPGHRQASLALSAQGVSNPDFIAWEPRAPLSLGLFICAMEMALVPIPGLFGVQGLGCFILSELQRASAAVSSSRNFSSRRQRPHPRARLESCPQRGPCFLLNHILRTPHVTTCPHSFAVTESRLKCPPCSLALESYPIFQVHAQGPLFTRHSVGCAYIAWCLESGTLGGVDAVTERFQLRAIAV